ncbi:glycosyltransferase family 4 protein [Candidatus Berkelbacteria bacterium]|nr:glycosyltransferase family 4 protein [Candidatus Berkelbacteria bacterium]
MENSRRISLVSAHFPPNVVGGAELNAAFLAELLTREGWDVVMLTGAAVLPRKPPYRIISVPALRPRPSLIYEPWWARRTAQKIQRLIGHSTLVHSFDVLSRAVVAEASHPKKVTTLQDISAVCGTINRLWVDGRICPGCNLQNLRHHCLTVQGKKGVARWARIARYWSATVRPYRKNLLDSYQAITTVSEFIKTFVGVPRAVVVPDLLHPLKPTCKLPHTTAPTILVVGRLAFDKGTDLILKALAELPEFLLEFVGRGDQARWQNLTHALKIADRVTFHEAIAHAEIGSWYQRADVVVLPSRAPEASSRSLLEAMSCGRAVVAPNYAGPKELIIDGSTGRLFDRGDPHDLARVIRQAYRERVSLGKRALAVSLKYHPDKVLPQYLELYRELLQA